MKGPRNAPALLSSGLLLLAPAVRAAPTMCADTLEVDAPPGAAAALRQEVARGRLASIPSVECQDSVAALSPRGGGWRLTLDRGGQQLSRDVDSIPLAAVWLESWLDPGFEAARPAPEPAPALPPPEKDRGALPTTTSVRKPGGPGLVVLAGGATSLATNRASFTGPELVVGLRPARALFLGPELGASFRLPAAQGAGERLVRGGLAVGVMAPLPAKLALVGTVAGGVASFSAPDTAKGVSSTGGYAGFRAALAREIARPLWVFAGVGGTWVERAGGAIGSRSEPGDARDGGRRRGRDGRRGRYDRSRHRARDDGHLPSSFGKTRARSRTFVRGTMTARVVALRAPTRQESSLSDEAVALACGSGDPEAIAELYDRFERSVTRYVSRHLRDLSDCEDVVQATFVEIARGRARFQQHSSAKTWVFGIATNVIRHHLRSASRRRKLSLAFGFARSGSTAPPQSAAVEARAELARVERALAALPEARRLAFVLCEVEGLSAREAAEVLGTSETAVWRRVCDARRALSLAIAEDA